MKPVALLFLIQIASLFASTRAGLAQEIYWDSTFGPPDNILKLVANRDGHIFALGVYDLYRTTDLGQTWTDLPGYASSGLGFVRDSEIVSLNYEEVVKSTDNGDNWVLLYSAFQNPLVTLATDGDDYIACWVVCTDPYCIPHMVRSFNGGVDWEMIFDGNEWPTDALIHPGGDMHIIRYGLVYRSTNLGTNWLLTSGISGSPNTLGVRQDGTFFAGSTDGLFVSLSGLAWEQRSLDSVSVNSIVFDEDGHLFAATSLGALSSADSGYTWTAINSGLADSIVTCLVASPDGYLYAGTETNGVYRSINITTGLNDASGGLPANLFLDQNYPNPFNAMTEIGFQIADYGLATLAVYDILGRKVATIANEKLAPGSYTRQWDATGFPSGVYLYRLTAGDFVQTRKLILIR